MKVLAKTIQGREFMYSARSARKVSARSAQYILDIVNQHGFLLDKEKGEIWHIYDVDQYDAAYDYAQYQAFTVRKGVVTARAY